MSILNFWKHTSIAYCNKKLGKYLPTSIKKIIIDIYDFILLFRKENNKDSKKEYNGKHPILEKFTDFNFNKEIKFKNQK